MSEEMCLYCGDPTTQQMCYPCISYLSGQPPTTDTFAFDTYQCLCGKYCHKSVFCSDCFPRKEPKELLYFLMLNPEWVCGDCRRPLRRRPVSWFRPQWPCRACLGAARTEPLTPEQLAAWVKEVRCD